MGTEFAVGQISADEAIHLLNTCSTRRFDLLVTYENIVLSVPVEDLRWWNGYIHGSGVDVTLHTVK